MQTEKSITVNLLDPVWLVCAAKLMKHRFKNSTRHDFD